MIRAAAPLVAVLVLGLVPIFPAEETKPHDETGSPARTQSSPPPCVDSADDFRAHFKQVRTIVLRTPDSVAIRRPSEVLIAPDGTIVVVDQADYDLKLFREDGRFLRTLGRRGSGPAGLRGRNDAELLGDSLVVIADDPGQKLVFFRRDGSDLHSVMLSARPVTGLVAVDDLLVVAGFGPWWNPDRKSLPAGVQILTHGGRLIRSIVPIPDYLRSFPRLARGALPVVARSPGGTGSLLVTWRFAPAVLEVDPKGTTLRRVPLPAGEHFRDPRPVLDSLAEEGAGPDRLFSTASPIVDLVSAGQRVLVGYVGAFAGDSRLRYHLFGEEMNHLASGFPGPVIHGSRGDTLITYRPPRSERGSTGGHPHLSYLVPCDT